jgi:hypothetical protein
MSAITSIEAAEEKEVVTPEQGQVTQEPDTATPETTDASQESFSEDRIPEKYVGKTPLEIMEMHRNAERALGRLGSEKAQKEREAEELRQRYAALEAQYAQQQQSQRQYTPPTQQQEQESDPIQVLEQTWHESPLEAVKRALHTKEQRDAYQRAIEQDQRNRAATAARWEELKRTNPDAAELEPTMVALSQQYAPFIAPEKRNSPEMLDLLYAQAKARNMDKYVQAEVEKRLQKSSAIKQEKRAAFSESSNTQGEATRDFSSLSLSEMEKVLGFANKD